MSVECRRLRGELFADPPVRAQALVRRAIALPDDAEHVVILLHVGDTILRGYGKIGNDHPIPEHDPFFNKELPIRHYDPEKAKFYLKQAGMESFSIDLLKP